MSETDATIQAIKAEISGLSEDDRESVEYWYGEFRRFIIGAGSPGVLAFALVGAKMQKINDAVNLPINPKL